MYRFEEDFADDWRDPSRPVVTIMADFGNGPYAWLREPGEKDAGVGGNIADAVAGFCGILPVSPGLEGDFARWAIAFENGYDDPHFNWALFNATGMVLTQRLADEVGASHRFFYVRASEDPTRKERERTEFSHGGTT